jgi:hypothetical protein
LPDYVLQARAERKKLFESLYNLDFSARRFLDIESRDKKTAIMFFRFFVSAITFFASEPPEKNFLNLFTIWTFSGGEYRNFMSEE